MSETAHAGLAPGSVLAGRYQILEMIGEGGMGAVYKASDCELDRVVALKVVRPQLARNPEMRRRFKEELIVARQITHRNVVRIYDLGISDGLKFISMEYIEGQDLRTRLEQRGKYAPREAAGIFRQICEGLSAAHAENVVHRDLKPRNVMIDGQGKVSIMDFGLARSTERSDVTRAGQMLGTPAYMSPEQVLGEKVDCRSDLFSAGIILYELVTGKLPFQSDTMQGMAFQRLKHPAAPLTEIDPSIPRPLSDIVAKCLAVDVAERYQSAGEVIGALDAWLAPPPRPKSAIWRWATVGLSALLLLAVVLIYRELTLRRSVEPKKVVTLLVADFDNATGDPLLDGTVESALAIALEPVSFVNIYSSGEARRIAAQVKPGATRLDEPAARLVAVREGINVVVSGSVARQDRGYRLSMKALDPVSGKVLATRETSAADKRAVLAAVSKLAAPVRKALGDETPESVQLAAAETFTASSLEAAHSYQQGQQLQTLGKWKEAIQAYEQSIRYDPNLGRAYAGVAAMYANLNERQQAEKYYQLAMAHIDRMTDREKYRTRGGYYLTVRNSQKAVEQYLALVKQYPADPAGYANLAVAYIYGRAMSQAQEIGQRAIVVSPKNVPQRNNLALCALYAGDFVTAEREARAVLQLSVSFEQAYGTLAVALLGQGKSREAIETYRRMEALGPRGASLAATGLADLAIYEGRLADAKSILEKGIDADLAGKNVEAAAEKITTLASVYLLAREPAKAAAAIDRALISGKEDIVLYGGARVYIEAGQEAKARPLADQFAARLEPDPQAYAKQLDGEILLKRGMSRDAIRLFQESQKLADTWLGRYALGRAYLAAGKFTEADAEFDASLKRRGEATAIFLDDVPTYRYLPPVYYYLGLAREGLKSAGAAEAFRQFLAIKKGGEDPQVADARRRLDSGSK
jgi:tetratricopeptide (TPR) repeat protein/predicted Ser/Thr protein kinase